MHRPSIQRQSPRRPRALRPVLVAFAVLLLPFDLRAQRMIEGNAVLTSRSGSIQVVENSGQTRSVEPRAGFNPNGLQWTTANNAQAFLAFSNGATLGIDESTRFSILDYKQQPFGPAKEGFSYEPSTSKLTIELESGQLALVARQISPISEVRVLLPHGSLRIHRGIAHIHYNQMGLHVAMIEGNLTYYYPGGTAREFISGGALVRISDQSAQLQQVAARLTVEALSAEAMQLHQAAAHASRRVRFKANIETDNPPEPQLVIRQQYYQQPSPRPYEFKK